FEELACAGRNRENKRNLPKIGLRWAQQSCAGRNSSGILDAENLSPARGADGATRGAADLTG
ncbi:hypothetical protein A2U01_0104844, partial [Trifolium medium]|nr:hypothetical protein [Trifolium medium]